MTRVSLRAPRTPRQTRALHTLRARRRVGFEFTSLPATLLVLLCAAALVLLPAAARAQSPEVVDELVRRVVADVADLRYAEAISRGRELLANASSLTVEQELRVRTALAAAFYPDFGGEQRPDSALAQFDRVIRLAPDATLPITLAWSGLDSLLEVSRGRTLAVVLRTPADSVGVDGAGVMLQVVATRAARFRLVTQRRGGGRAVVHDSVGEPSRSAALRLRAHDAGSVLLQTGEYDLVVTAIDAVRGDSLRVTRRIVVRGDAPTTLAVPVLDSTRLRGETRVPKPWRTALTGFGFGLLAVAIADGARADEPLRSAFDADARAGLVAVAAIAAGGVAAWSDRDGIDDDAAAYNAALREAHERSVSAAAAENARRLASHRVSVVFVREAR